MISRAIPYEGAEPYVFLSYCHKDAARVYPLLEQMVRDGYRVWYDDGNHVGDDWLENIAGHLDGCAACLAMISEQSAASHNCRNEISFAIECGKKLMAVMLEEFRMPIGMRMQLGTIHYLKKPEYPSDRALLQKLYEVEALAVCKAAPGSLPMREAAPDLPVNEPAATAQNDAVAGFIAAERRSVRKEETPKRQTVDVPPEPVKSEPAKPEPQTAEPAPEPAVPETKPDAAEVKPIEHEPQPDHKKRRAKARIKVKAEVGRRRPAPEAEKPIPAEQKPEPEAEKPIPAEQKPEPEVEKPIPAEQKPEPEVEKPIPAEQKPEPEAEKPTPAEQKPEPEAEKPTPAELDPSCLDQTAVQHLAHDHGRMHLLAAYMQDDEGNSATVCDGWMNRFALDDGEETPTICVSRQQAAVLVRLSNGNAWALQSALTRIGRSRRLCDVVVAGNGYISNCHAEIIQYQGQYYLHDAGSMNGTYAGGQRLAAEERFTLVDGTVFLLDQEAILFVSGTIAEQIVSGSRVWFLRNPHTGGVKLLTEEPLLLDRGHRWEDGTLSDEKISRSNRHAKVTGRDGALWLEDLGSSNGTYLNEQDLRGEGPQRLKERDQIRLGDTVLEVGVITLQGEEI